MFGLKNNIIIVLMLFISWFLVSATSSGAERTATNYALCITKSPFKDCFFLQFFIIEAKGNASLLTRSVGIPINRETLEPVLNKDQYEIIARRFLLKANRSYQITSPESNSPDSSSFSFQGSMKERPDSSFELTYKYYEENKAGACRKLEGSLQVEPDKIQLIGGFLREETPIPVTAQKTSQKTTGESAEK